MRERQDGPTGLIEVDSSLLLRENIRVERFETVPLAVIDMSDAIISHKKVEALKKNIRKERQKVPVYLRLRLIDYPGSGKESIVYDPMDGYHRIAALQKMQQEEGDNGDVAAIVSYGMTDAEVYEHRFLAIHSAPEILFRRAIRWLPEIYNTTPFAQKMSLIEALEKSREKQMMTKLTENEERELRAFITEKSQQCKRSIGDMEAMFRSIEGMAPDVIAMVELTKGKAKPFPGMISRSSFERLADSYRGKENYEIQRGLARYIGEYGLLAPYVENLLERISGMIQPGMDADSVYKKALLVPLAELIFTNTKDKTFFPLGSSEKERESLDLEEVQKLRAENEALKERESLNLEEVQRLREENEALKRRIALFEGEYRKKLSMLGIENRILRRMIKPKQDKFSPPHTRDGQFYESDWVMYRKCGSDLDAMFVSGARQNDVKKICNGCQVQVMCLATELKAGEDAQLGVWGGLTERERRKMLRDKPQQVKRFIQIVEKNHGKSL